MHESQENETTPKKLRRFFALLWIVVPLFIGLAIYVISNSENGGQVVNNTAERLAREVPTTTTKTIDTPFYSLEYNSEFEQQENPQKNPELLDLQVLLSHSEKKSPGSIRVSLGVEQLPAGGITEMSPYNLAESFPDKYTIEQITHDGITSYIFTKYDDGSAKIVLLPHNDVVLVMALASQTIGDKPKYDAFIDQAVDSLVWK